MTGSFRKLALGLLFVLLDIKIGNFDIIPDFIGYGISYFALNELSRHRSNYRQAGRLALILLLMSSLGDIYFTAAGRSQTGGAPYEMVFGGAVMLLKLYMAFMLFESLTKHALESNHIAFADRVRNRKHFYLFAAVLLLLTIPFTLNFPKEMQIPSVIGLVFGLLAEVVLFFTVRRAAKELHS